MLSTVSVLAAACLSLTSDASSAATLAAQKNQISETARPTISQTQGCSAFQRATWMQCLVQADPAFGSLPISGLALPGSHNAGTFNLDQGGFDTHPSSCTNWVSKDSNLGNTFNRWSQTQDETILDQLDQGIRFIDLQVAYNGTGSALDGWRVVQSQFSELPLYDYLDQIAAWAKIHPSEPVIVDFSNICYDKANGIVAKGLLSNLATPSNVPGGGNATLAEVAYDAGPLSRSFATTTIDQVVDQGGGGHNVVVLMPNTVKYKQVLTTRYHVDPVFTVRAGTKATGSSRGLPVAVSDAAVTPITSSKVAAANSQLARAPLAAKPALGSQVGTGLYEVLLAYTFVPSEQKTLFKTFGGLIQPYSVSATGSSTTLPPWEEGLWAPSIPRASSRNEIVARWGHRANVVLADGVEYDGFIPSVIALNAG
jgi:hypothetical protein